MTDTPTDSPNDIPQDIWDAAAEPAKAVYNDAFLWDDAGGSDGMYLDNAITTAIIARAILAERSRAASLIESQAIEIGQRDDLLIRAEKLRFGPDLTVESRGRSLWAVCCPGEVLNAAGLWEWEPQPSSRTDDFIARTRFTFAEAVTKARALNPNNPSPDVRL